jgi:hypothetical protein
LGDVGQPDKGGTVMERSMEEMGQRLEAAQDEPADIDYSFGPLLMQPEHQADCYGKPLTKKRLWAFETVGGQPRVGQNDAGS